VLLHLLLRLWHRKWLHLMRCMLVLRNVRSLLCHLRLLRLCLLGRLLRMSRLRLQLCLLLH